MKKSKKASRTKEKTVNVRCTEEQKVTLEKIASREGLGLSTWLLHVGLLAAQERRARAEQ